MNPRLRAPERRDFLIAEAKYAQQLDEQGKLWFYQPKVFPLKRYGSYRPDFYVVDDNCFIEVVGTSSTFSKQRAKIQAFQEQYPHLKLIIQNGGAWKNGPRLTRRAAAPPKLQKTPAVQTSAVLRILAARYVDSDLAVLQHHLEWTQIRTLHEFARSLKVGYSVLRIAFQGGRVWPVLREAAKALP